MFDVADCTIDIPVGSDPPEYGESLLLREGVEQLVQLLIRRVSILALVILALQGLGMSLGGSRHVDALGIVFTAGSADGAFTGALEVC